MLLHFRSRHCLKLCCIVIFLTLLIAILIKTSLELANLIDQDGFIKIENIPSTSERVEKIEEESEEEWHLDNENIPDLKLILGRLRNGPKGFGGNCAKFPDLNRIQFSNIHWQVQATQNEKYFFYSAYLDARDQALANASLNNLKVQVLAMADVSSLNETSSTLKICQFWFENQKKPAFGLITELKLLWLRQWGNRGRYYPYLITCQMPEGWTEVPVSISLTSHTCESATNNLNIVHRERATQSVEERTPTKDIAVCVKALDYPNENITSRLIEWIEMLRILGAEKIFFYEYFIDSDIKKMLHYYETREIIDVAQTTLPGDFPNHPQLRNLYIKANRLNKRLTELIPYNDCLYRNLYEYKYLLIVDIDELIIPAENITWPALIDVLTDMDSKDKSTQRRPYTTYCFQNIYFLNGMLREDEVSSIPPTFHMLRHIFKTSNHSTGSKYTKCFHATEFTTGVHNHYPFICRNRCRYRSVSVDLAQMNHYRDSCVIEVGNCAEFLLETEKDDKIWRYKDELIDRVQTVLQNIK